MKLAMLATALLIQSSTPTLADPIYGLWKTNTENGEYAYIKIAPCGTSICGHINRTFSDQGEISSPLLGKKIVWGLKADQSGNYSGGKIWRRSNQKIYSLKMSLTKHTLKIKGCFLGICQNGGFWTRVE